MGEAEFLDVGDQPVGKLEIGQFAMALFGHTLPRPGMDFVDRHRRTGGMARLPRRHPGMVAPFELGVVIDDTRGLRRHLAAESIGIDLERQNLAGPRLDLELVKHAFVESGDEDLPHAAAGMQTHRMAPPVPGVEIANDADAPCVGCPDREIDAADTVDLGDVRAHLFIGIEMAAFGQ